MFRIFQGDSADQVWIEIAREFWLGHSCRSQDSRLGRTAEIQHAAISISDARKRWVLSRVPPINPAYAIVEVVWIVNGREDSRFLNFFNPQLPKFQGDTPTYYGAYGHRLRNSFGIDQIERAYLALKNNPTSRQVVLQIWDAARDLPSQEGKEASLDIPCNVIAMLKVRDGKLEWTQVMRSNDAFLGIPYNIVQFTTLQEIMAGWLGLEVGSYNHVSDSLHIYEDAYNNVAPVVPVQVEANNDSLALSKQDSEEAFSELANVVDSIVDGKVLADQLIDIVEDSGLTEPLKNVLCLICAEAARRMGSAKVADEIIKECSNPVYNQGFRRWHSRFRRELQA